MTRPANSAVDTRPLLLDELLHVIRQAIRSHPRSQQTRIGPSEIGVPCDRRIAHKLLGTKPVNDRGAPWLPTIGTAVHAWLDDTFSLDNLPAVVAGQPPRWLVEQKVTTGQVAGEDIDGSCDLYDTITGTSVDWKIVGKTKLRDVPRHGPGSQYQVQGHLYGRGWAAKGYPVNTVAVLFLPRNEELDAAEWWSEPYNEQVAIEALARVEAIGLACKVLGPAAPGVMKTADAYCGYCPYFQLNATDLTKACPGDPRRPKPNDSVTSLIAPRDEMPADTLIQGLQDMKERSTR